MSFLATSTEVWAFVGLTIVTLPLLMLGVILAWVVLDRWIGDSKSYSNVIASIEKH
jgi:hypothetical protein